MGTPLADPSAEPVLSLPCRFGRYRLTKLLAQGGMAQIYLAKAFGAEGFIKPLVIKRLTPSMSANAYFSSLFVNEAKLLVTLNHGNIVPVFDFGRVGDDLFMAIEHVDGASLRQMMTALMQIGERLDAALVAYVGAEVCKGLGYAHRRTDTKGQPAGIVHRDVKPNNVLISMDGEVKLVDFGVAKLAGRGERHGQLTGTIAYMSPEQAERRAVDHRTDIFSTGLLLYELLTFRRAYDVTSPKDALVLARRGAVPPPPPDVPQELRDIIRRATHRDPEQRFATASEMEVALSDYLVRARAVRSGGEAESALLSALMKRLPIDRPEIDLTSEDLDPTAADQFTHDEVSGIVEPGDPPDLKLIHNAAETLHSAFITRVLREEITGVMTESRMRRLLLIAASLVLMAAVCLGFWAHSRGKNSKGGGGAGPTTRPAADAGRRLDGGAPPRADGGRPSDLAQARPDRRRTPPVVSRPKFGYLNLNSIPWSEVSIDGRPVGRPTPLLKLKVRAGEHTVTLVNREKKLRMTLQVTIRPGATTWKVVYLK